MYIDVYEGDNNFVTSSATLLSDLDLQKTYKAINGVATSRMPSLICAPCLHAKEVANLFVHAYFLFSGDTR